VILKLRVVYEAYIRNMERHRSPVYQCKEGEDKNVELRVPGGKFIRIDGLYF